MIYESFLVFFTRTSGVGYIKTNTMLKVGYHPLERLMHLKVNYLYNQLTPHLTSKAKHKGL